MLLTFEVWHGRNPIYTLTQAVPLVLMAVYLLRFIRQDLGAAVSCMAMTMGAISHFVVAAGNILIVTGIKPELDLYQAASIDLLVFLFVSVIWNFGLLVSAVERERVELDRLANEDELTGIANRRQFVKHLQKACDGASGGEPFSVLLFDLDRFKPINDKYGHAAGDAALKHVAGVIKKKLRKGDVFARIGGDEFGLVLIGAPSVSAATIANQIITAIRANPLYWQAMQLPLTVSIGIVSPHGSSSDPEVLLDSADQALYETKRRGRNGYSIFVTDPVPVSNVIRLTEFPSSGSPRP
jgi:diguanylate cyclase (GGDEF)-like protein